MSNHELALVPLASGYFQSPELLGAGRKADVGIFAESLIYYDSVYVHMDNPEQFAYFIGMLIQQGLSFEALNALIEEGTLRFYKTATVHPVMGCGIGPRTIVTSFQAIQEQAMLAPDYFAKKFLKFEGLQAELRNLKGFNQNVFNKFRQLAEGNSITLSYEEVGEDIVDNAYEDFLTPHRCKHVTRNIFEGWYKAHQLGELPDFEVKIREMDGDNWHEIAHNPRTAVFGRHTINGGYRIYEVDFGINAGNLKSLETGKPILSFETLPLSCAAVTNVYIKSAGKLKCDLFLPKPICNIVGDKLYEINDSDISNKDDGIKNIIESLKAEVAFPDLQRLVNASEIDLKKVPEIRGKSKRFREWLQTESGRDAEAIVAYHGEVARQSGFTNIDKRSLQMFGVLSLLSIYSNIRFKEDVSTKKDAKKSDDEVSRPLFDYGAQRLGDDWKPVCFGNWYKDEIARLLEGTKNDR